MKFKVWDKVISKKQVAKEELATLLIPNYLWELVSMGVFTISELSIIGNIKLKEEALELWFKSEWFELAEQPKTIEPRVGDVWKSEKGEAVRVLSVFENKEGDVNIGFIVVNGLAKGMAYTCKASEVERTYVTLLHRPQKPKKQPKPVAETPKKQKEEEKWEPVIGNGIDSTRCFRKGNSIKWVQNDCEGIATCNKKDTFDLLFGMELAWYRAVIKYFEGKIAEMLKEGAK